MPDTDREADPMRTSSDVSAPLTRPQREALRLLVEHEERVGRPLEPGDAGTYVGTWHDNHTTGIHWRTANALWKRKLIIIDSSYCDYDEPADIFLTHKGREVARAQNVRSA